jgi:hypothetical protein
LGFGDAQLAISAVSECVGAGCNPSANSPYGQNLRALRIRGFAPLLEIFQSYVPQAATIGFTVPSMPEGMLAADHFDTYWGNLAHPVDFAQAHPLQCGYPATAPHVGDYLTVADTVPTPSPGQGVYYVTAATYLGAIRRGCRRVCSRSVFVRRRAILDRHGLPVGEAEA